MTDADPIPDDLSADAMHARVLYRNADLIVLNKPAGLPVHYGTGVTRHLDEALPHLAFELPDPPRLAHRLDRETSGCLVLGRHAAAATRLGRLFMAGRIEKIYWAVVYGRPRPVAARIDRPLRKIAGATKARMEVDPTGKPATTDYRTIAAGAEVSWLELRPLTGRTHQLRAHCAVSGFPILGDPLYGPDPSAPSGGMHLHAREIVIPWGRDAPAIRVGAPVPPVMARTFAACGFDDATAA